MTVWYTSDLHAYHKRIREFEPCRPEHFEEIFRQNYLSIVKPEDVVIWLGDIALCSGSLMAKYFSSLPGTKHLIKGNHDKKSNEFYRQECGFRSVTPLYGIRGELLLSHYPLTTVDDRFQDRVAKLNRVFAQNALVAQVHGHTHSKLSKDLRCFNACVEMTGMMPIREVAVLGTLECRFGRMPKVPEVTSADECFIPGYSEET